MAINLGTGVSKTVEDQGYNYDMVVFQKGKPILDTELNLVQQLQNGINQRNLSQLASGWLTCYPFKTDTVNLTNMFYTQDPVNPKPEYALVNGMVVHFTGTNPFTTSIAENLNMINLGEAPQSGNAINGVFLEVWRALLDPDNAVNKPEALNRIDGLRGVYFFNSNVGWSCGESGLVLGTTNGGITWNVKNTGTKNNLNGISFLDVNKGFVVGDQGTILSTSSSGNSWVPLTSPTTYNLNSVFVYDAKNIWAVGDAGTILKTTNGVTWFIKSSNIITDLNKVFFINDQIGWAVGAGGVILRSTNGGNDWVKMNSGITTDLNSVYFHDVNFGFAVGPNSVILSTSDGGVTWVSKSTTVTVGDFNDVTMFPEIDQLVKGEEVSSQLKNGVKTFTVSHYPITLGDGRGTTLNYPAGESVIKVEVTDSVTNTTTLATISSVSGDSGKVTISSTVKACDTVKVTYYYKLDSAIFTGRVWAVGNVGKLYYTSDLGSSWSDQKMTTNTRDLMGVYFVDGEKGWAVGASATVIHTQDHGQNWSLQPSAVLSRTVQRIYPEGNTDANTGFLEDNSIHPDAAVQTTKRVQVQYRVRVETSVDPFSNPEAGLYDGIKGYGPNDDSVTLYPYENMGSTTGDYGLWQAKCSNTVDDYCWAIPMFFVSRRNKSEYSTDGNANGQQMTGVVRPDLLTASMVADADILDVRRKVIVPDLTALLNENVNLLLNNKLQTNYLREATGGSERYATDMLQVDSINGGPGDNIVDATMNDAYSGNISSEGVITLQASPATLVSTGEYVFTIPSGVDGKYHPDWSYYKAVFSPLSTLAGKKVPGNFERISDLSVKFVIRTTGLEPTDTCIFTAAYVKPNTKSLKFIPSQPLLVTSYGPSSKFFYNGVSDAVDSRVIERWASSVAGYENYVQVYSAKESSDPSQRARASLVELHYFVEVSSETGAVCEFVDANNIILKIYDNSAYFTKYPIKNVYSVRNVSANFSHKIVDSYFEKDLSGLMYTKITSATGLEFHSGELIEVIAPVIAEPVVSTGADSTNYRNGAAVNFSSSMKGINTFTDSTTVTLAGTGSGSNFKISLTGYNILGISSADTTGNPQQPVVWTNLNAGSSNARIHPVSSFSGFGSSTLDVTTSETFDPNKILQTQVLRQQVQVGTDTSMSIAYNHNPYQSVKFLPDSLTVKIQEWPETVFVSNLGTGGGNSGEPYTNPLEQIPIGDPLTTSDGFFQNKDSMKFNSFSVQSGLVKLSVTVPGNIGDEITLTGSSPDAQGRVFYGNSSRNFIVEAEGLQISAFRKIFMPVIAEVTGSSDGKFLPGELLMIVFSKTSTSDVQNKTGMVAGSSYAAAVYRLPNKPIVKIGV